jgi:fatty-acyl-CoA synthase
MLSHRAILEQVAAYTSSLRFDGRDSVASWLPLYHDMGFVACFLLSLINGTHLVKLDPFEWVARPGLIFDAIERHRTTLTWLPNFAFAHLVNATPPTRDWDLSSVRAFIDCSEPCRPETLTRFIARFAASGVTAHAAHVCYAMAENVFAVTQTDLRTPPTVVTLERDAFAIGRIVLAADEVGALRAISCGKPLPSVEIALAGAASAAHCDGELQAGEILVRSPFLFNGYYQLPGPTQAAFRDGWFATGDVGFIAGEDLYVIGRLDDMLIVNGRNYYAHEIETIANGVQGVKPGRAVAVSLRVTSIDATVIAMLLECGPGSDESKLKRSVKELVFDHLALALHSVTIVPRGTLIKTTSGKLDRCRNAELFFTYAAYPGGLQIMTSTNAVPVSR